MKKKLKIKTSDVIVGGIGGGIGGRIATKRGYVPKEDYFTKGFKLLVKKWKRRKH